MIRMNFGLFALVLVLALAVVNTQHRARRSFIDLQREHDLTEQHLAEWNSLQIEQGLLSSSHRIEEVATRSLQMELPKDSDTSLVLLNVPAPAPGSAPVMQAALTTAFVGVR